MGSVKHAVTLLNHVSNMSAERISIFMKYTKKDFMGQAPVEFAALLFYEEFNGAGANFRELLG